MQRTYVIYGVSQGLGQAILQSIPQPEDKVFGISRTQPQPIPENLTWISADLSKPEHARDLIKQHIQQQKVDCLIYNVGIWENKAFQDDYDFASCTDHEISSLIQINIHSCILAIQSLTENLRLSENAKIILIGSTWGLDHHQGKEVVFSASKFALRGMVQALRNTLRTEKTGISLLNLGYLATEYTIQTPIETVLAETRSELIPLQDVIHAIRFILSTSPASCVKQIDMPAMLDTGI